MALGLLRALALPQRLRMEYASDLAEPLTYTERMVMRAFKPYIAYLNAGCTFDLTNTRHVLPDYDAMFPTFDAAYLERVVALHRAAFLLYAALMWTTVPEKK
jgi:predicted  nucleic acid-binding Zn ribbon protein